LSMSGANRFPGGNGNPGRHPGGYGNQPVYGGQQGGEEDMYNQGGWQQPQSGPQHYNPRAMNPNNQGYYNQPVDNRRPAGGAYPAKGPAAMHNAAMQGAIYGQYGAGPAGAQGGNMGHNGYPAPMNMRGGQNVPGGQGGGNMRGGQGQMGRGGANAASNLNMMNANQNNHYYSEADNGMGGYPQGGMAPSRGGYQPAMNARGGSNQIPNGRQQPPAAYQGGVQPQGMSGQNFHGNNNQMTAQGPRGGNQNLGGAQQPVFNNEGYGNVAQQPAPRRGGNQDGGNYPSGGRAAQNQPADQNPQQARARGANNQSPPANWNNGQYQAPANNSQFDTQSHTGGAPSVSTAPQAGPPGENNLTAQNEITLKKYNTLDRGTYFIDQANKSINFIIDSDRDLLGWHDDYLINGYLLYGVVIKVTTLTSRVYLFIEKDHEIYQNCIRVDETGKLRWKGLSHPNEFHIATVCAVEKVEIYDNSEDGFEGFVCYTVNEDSTLEFNPDEREVQDWVQLQRNLLLFEPTSIKRIFLDLLHNLLHQPESTKFQGKSVAAIINPKIQGDAVIFTQAPKFIPHLEEEYYVGQIALQYGRYTLLCSTKEAAETFPKLVEKIFEIAEELGAYVMITNLKRNTDNSAQQKTVLILPSDPTLKIIRYDGQMNFDKTKDKLSKAITM
jgi:hypothetical protein